MDHQQEIKHVLDRLSRWEQKIHFHKPTDKNSDIIAYLDYYGFQLENVAFHLGKLEIDGTDIMVQMFSPRESKGTVFLLHGYLDHVGYLQRIIQFLNDHHYSVISYDLQGHGLSEGEKASVDAFSDYVLTLEKLMKKARDEMPDPFYVIGHSTGGAIAINYVLKHRNHRFNKVVLAAPLIRSKYWHLTKLGHTLAKPFPFIDDINRHFRKNSSNQKYLSLAKKDPLQPQAIPLEWVDALIEWNENIQTYTETTLNTCVIQGDEDDTVAQQYNLEFIEDKFQNLQVFHIEKGRHQLFNEQTQIREKVFAIIKQFLLD
ncbi:alpha/beta hydrolase [Tuberibacillus sp. Marseille-P3662]|uniref:alpha/beta hydrolase n=1 Tax=Tuberibacillus sp. Marseille-P3662 TaxID=1965358 RepID=UPI000A1CAD73|nr:alpha/beta hydrolase [Tuberibacillus sp. Marseille-P3662]